MKSFRINRIIIIALLLFLTCSTYATISGCRLLQIRIDEQSRVYWNIFNPADSLPHLLPPKFPTPDSLRYKIDMRGLYDLLMEKNRAIEKLNNIILIHPDAHYSSLDRILTALHWIEWVWNDKTAYELGISANELDDNQKFSCRYAIRYWEDRDNRILEATWKARNITPSEQSKITLDQTFKYKSKNGYWIDKIPEIVGPSMAKPKIRILKPVSDEEIIDLDVMIASRENLAEIIAHKEKEDATDKLEIDKMLPGPNEFVPVEIPAEQIYYHEPVSPRINITSKVEAVVWVKALVDKEGRVCDAMILKSSGSKAGFDEASLKAAYKCRYKPAIQNGQPVAVWISYEVKFVMPPDSQSQK
ncbi:MAG: energy transducer TonB [candidate division Zixibacteria bacterium]|nr:energy transducer TonB [candidate division Zixibacteria bacterium]